VNDETRSDAVHRRLLSHGFSIILLALLISACQPAQPICGLQMANSGESENVCGFEVPQNAGEARIFMQVKLRSGRMVWTLEDPRGEVVWRGFADSSLPVEKSTSIQNPMPGTWSLRVESYRAVGEFSAPWLVE
jgi:hypothetical protein